MQEEHREKRVVWSPVYQNMVNLIFETPLNMNLVEKMEIVLPGAETAESRAKFMSEVKKREA
jgi:Na+/phosphate symporter